jgi:hypothetical protein
MTNDKGHDWYAGWYVSKLHAVSEQTPRERTMRALCGAEVYLEPPTEWAAARLDRVSVPRCKSCERQIARLRAARATPVTEY